MRVRDWSQLVVLVLLAACNGEAKRPIPRPQAGPEKPSSSSCSYASVKVRAELKDGEMVALAAVRDPAVKQTRLSALETRAGHIDRYFFGHCLEVAPEHASCIENIDDYVSALSERRSSLLLCDGNPQVDGSGSTSQPEKVPGCRNDAIARAEQRIGPCGAVIEQILAAVDKQAAEAKK